jgi:hypothetical protein
MAAPWRGDTVGRVDRPLEDRPMHPLLLYLLVRDAHEAERRRVRLDASIKRTAPQGPERLGDDAPPGGRRARFRRWLLVISRGRRVRTT